MRCRVCASPNLSFYERKRSEGKKYVILSGMATRSHGETLKAVEFKRHFEMCKRGD